MSQIKKYESLTDKESGHDLLGSAEIGAYWMMKKTKCPWPGKCLHWEHCNEESMNHLDSTLRAITKTMVSIGNLLADGLIFMDNSFAAVIKGLEIIQKQKEGGEGTSTNKTLEQIEQKFEKLIQEKVRTDFEQLSDQIDKLSVRETNKFDKFRLQNEELINKINEINLSRLEQAIMDLNEKIPNIEPIFEEFRKTSRTLEAIGKAIGYEE